MAAARDSFGDRERCRSFRVRSTPPFGTYTYGKQTVIGPTGTPHFSTALPVASVMHLQTYDSRRGYNIRGTFANFAGYTPQMIASGFDFSGAYAAG